VIDQQRIEIAQLTDALEELQASFHKQEAILAEKERLVGVWRSELETHKKSRATKETETNSLKKQTAELQATIKTLRADL
jgi:chromosome segregation ATPase